MVKLIFLKIVNKKTLISGFSLCVESSLYKQKDTKMIKCSQHTKYLNKNGVIEFFLYT